MARSLTTDPKAVDIPAGAACWLQTHQGTAHVLVEEEMLPAKACTTSAQKIELNKDVYHVHIFLCWLISQFKMDRENVKIEMIRTSQSPKVEGKVREPRVAAVACGKRGALVESS